MQQLKKTVWLVLLTGVKLVQIFLTCERSVIWCLYGGDSNQYGTGKNSRFATKSTPSAPFPGKRANLNGKHIMHPKIIPSILTVLLSFSSTLAAHDFSALFEELDPSVVVLHTFTSKADATGNNLTSDSSLGTGVVINKKGWILTAAHVVHTTDSVHVEFKDGQKKIGKVIASEPMADLALLEVKELPANIRPVKLGDSDQVKVGNEIMVIGSPYGFKHTLTTGHISARHASEDLDTPFFEGEFFQTDAAINSGNSGGPVFNLDGELIAIVSHIQSRSGGYEGLGFAVTSKTVQKVLLDGKKFWTGINTIPITPKLASMLNYPLTHGALVQSVAHGSPSDNAGIREGEFEVMIGKKKIYLGGDILVSVEGIKIGRKENFSKINSAIKKVAAGGQFDVTIYRAGEFTNLSITKP
jgi:S1-C subfamily serine protease